jgi:hypothetical protein
MQPDDCSSCFTTAMNSQFLFNAVVVGVGWLIVHYLSKKRDLDKARRELIAKSVDSLIQAMTSLLGDARKYHSSARSLELEVQIKMSIQDIAESVSGLKSLIQDKGHVASCQLSVRKVRAAITGAHFEDEHSEPLDGNSGTMQTIADEVMRSKRALTNLKHSLYNES